jgi:hypothetical protein
MDEERKKTILNAMLDLGSIALHALRSNEGIDKDTISDGEQTVCMIQALITKELDVDTALILEVMANNKARFKKLDDLKRDVDLDDEWINSQTNAEA